MTTTALSEVLAEIRENTSIMPGKYWADRIESALASAEPVLGWANPRDVEKVRRPRSKRDGSALAVFIHGEQSEDYSIPIYTHAKPAAKVEALCSDSDIADAISGLEEAYRFASTSPRAQEAINFAIEVMSRTAAPTPASDYPECSGDPASCPENEGHGCCKPNPVKTPASVPDYSYIIERIAASWDECMHVDSLDSVIDIGADIRDQWKRFVSDATNPAPASLEGFGPMPSPDLSGLTIRPTTPEPTP